MIMWNVYYLASYGSRGTWNVWAKTESEAIAVAMKEHSYEMKKGYQITGVAPAN